MKKEDLDSRGGPSALAKRKKELGKASLYERQSLMQIVRGADKSADKSTDEERGVEDRSCWVRGALPGGHGPHYLQQPFK